MKSISCFYLRRAACGFVLLLEIIFLQSMLFAQELDKVKDELFREINVAIQRARQEEALTFAPTLFARAFELYNRAEADYKRGERIDKIREQLQRALKAVNDALAAAKVSKVALAELSTTRQEAANREFINLAPKEFAQAERDYQEAILKAEAGDIRAAREKAEQAMQDYREMAIVALLEGPIKNAAANLKQSEPTLSREAFAKATRELAALKQSVENFKKQSFKIADYAAKIRANIDAIIEITLPEFYKNPPKILLIGSFTMTVSYYENKGSYNFVTKEISALNGFARIKFDCGSLKITPPWKDAALKPYDFIVVDKVIDPKKEISKDDAALVDPQVQLGQKLTVELPEAKGEYIDISKSVIDWINKYKFPEGVRVRFENLTIAPTNKKEVGLVKAGYAFYPTDPAIPKVPIQLDLSGFTLEIYSLKLTITQAEAKAKLVLPNSLVAGSECKAAWLNLGAIDITPKCEFYKELPDSTYGPMEVGNTTMIISGKGYVADFSPTQAYAASGQTPSWKGVVLMSGATTEEPAGSVISNIGYLKAKYAFSNALITAEGLLADLTCTSAYAYSSLQPFGYDIAFNAATIRIQASMIRSGQLQSGTMILPKTAVRDAAMNAIIAHFSMIEVQPTQTNIELFGEVTVAQAIHWGELTQKGSELRAYSAEIPGKAYAYFSAALREPYFPVKGDKFDEPGLNLPQAELKTKGIQGATLIGLKPFEFKIYTPDIPGKPPITLEVGQSPSTCWMNIVTRGIHGSMVSQRKDTTLYLGPTYSSQYVGKVPFETVLPGVEYAKKQLPVLLMNFVESAVFKSDMRGYMRLEGPSKINLPFNEMVFTSTAHNAGGKVDLSNPVTLDYWGVEVVQKKNFSSAGLVSVKTGQIILTAAGIREKRHYAEPFYLTWGEMLATGELGRLFFDYNTAGQKFDGFNFVPQAVALSTYDPTPGKWGYLKACGFIHFPFFGPEYMNIHDWKEPAKSAPPHNGRKIELSFDKANQCQPTDTKISANWADGFGNFNYTIAYSDADQDGFVGTGTANLLYIKDGSLSSTIVLKSSKVCIEISEPNSRILAFEAVPKFSGLVPISGNGCLEGDQLKQLTVNGDLGTDKLDNAVISGEANCKVVLLLSPAHSKVTIDGNAHLSLFAEYEVYVEGAGGAPNAHFDLEVDRDNGFVEGNISAKFSLKSGGTSSLQAEGAVNWHLGDYSTIQGKLTVRILTVGFGGGFYVGHNAPSEKAWVLQEANLSTDAFEKNGGKLTGIYGYASYSKGIELGFVFSGSVEVFLAYGLFLISTPVPVLTGHLGGGIHGEILGGFVSASATLNQQINGPYPGSFEGTAGLEGCVCVKFLGCACKSVNLTVGLSMSETPPLYIKW